MDTFLGHATRMSIPYPVVLLYMICIQAMGLYTLSKEPFKAKNQTPKQAFQNDAKRVGTQTRHSFSPIRPPNLLTSPPPRYKKCSPLTVRAVLREILPLLVLEERQLLVRLRGVARLVLEPGRHGEDEPGAKLPGRPPQRPHVGLVLGLDDADALA